MKLLANKWLRRLVLVALIVGALYLARRPLLIGLGGLLVVDEPCADATVLMVSSAEGCFAEAAQMFHAGPATRILVMPEQPRRLEKMGIRPLFADLARRELTRRNIPADKIQVTEARATNLFEFARELALWLRENPDDRVALLCMRFETRRIRLILDRELPADLRSRVCVVALPGSIYAGDDWWQHKAGVLDFFHASLNLLHTWYWGENREGHAWDPDQYEKNLVANGGAG